MDPDLENIYRQRLGEHGFSLRTRRDGIHEIFKGSYLKMVGDLERAIEGFLAAVGGIRTRGKTENDDGPEGVTLPLSSPVNNRQS